MFQSVRPNSPIYIFHKGNNPHLEIGSVASTPMIKPKYQIPSTFGQPQEMVVELSVKLNGQNVTYSGLPAQLDIADSFSNGESIVVADSKEAMNSEIANLRQKSVDIINSKEFHEHFISGCDKALSELNPEFAEKQAQKERIELLESQVSEMTKNIGELMNTNRQLIEQLSKKENQL